MVITMLAGVLGVAVAGAGGFHHSGFAVMAGGVYKGVLIAAAADGAGVGGYSPCGCSQAP